MIRILSIIGFILVTTSHLDDLRFNLKKPLNLSSEFLIKTFVAPNYCHEPKRFDGLSKSFFLFLTLSKVDWILNSALLSGFVEFFKKKNFVYIKGEFPEQKSLPSTSFLTLNACLFEGGLPLYYGGICPSGDRIEPLSKLIISQEADFVLMQEVSSEPGLNLIDKLKKNYAHFYTNIGPNPWRMESCLFFASKIALKSIEFMPFPFHQLMKRGVFIAETSDYWVLNTHLEAGETTDDIRIRELEMGMIREIIHDLKERSDKPCFLLGDFNVRRGNNLEDEYHSLRLQEFFYDDYEDEFPELTAETATCTDYFENFVRGNPLEPIVWEIVDYALIDKASKNQFDLKVSLIETFKLTAPAEALSDHRGLLLRAIKK